MLSDSRYFLLLRKVTARGNAMQLFIKIRHIYVFPMERAITTRCTLAGSNHKKTIAVAAMVLFYITFSSKVD